jgi:hypothetical protein
MFCVGACCFAASWRDYAPLLPATAATATATAMSAAAAAMSAAAATMSAAAATTTFGGLVDANRSPIKLRTMELRLSSRGAVTLGEGYESEASGTPGVTVGDDLGVSYFTKGFKVCP